MPNSFTSAFFQSQRHGGIRSYLADVNTPFSPKAYTQPEKKKKRNKNPQKSIATMKGFESSRMDTQGWPAEN